MSAAHVRIERPRASRPPEANYREFAPPLAITAVKFSRGTGNPIVSTLSLGVRFPSEYPHSVLEPLDRTIPSPSERNATAKQGSGRPPPIACNLPPCACILTRAFANSPIRTQRTSLKRGCWIVAQRRVSCRWPTPQRKAEKIPAARIHEMTASWSRHRNWSLFFAQVERLLRSQEFAHPAQQPPPLFAAAVCTNASGAMLAVAPTRNAMSSTHVGSGTRRDTIPLTGGQQNPVMQRPSDVN
jgi:hypothetical protein